MFIGYEDFPIIRVENNCSDFCSERLKGFKPNVKSHKIFVF